MSGTAPTTNGAGYVVPLLINGEERRTGKVFDVVSPVSGKVSHQCTGAVVADADAAVNAAAEAFKTWKKSTPKERRDLLLKAAELMEKRQDELATCLTSETGGTAFWGNFIMGIAINYVKDLAGRVTTIGGSFTPTQNADISSIVVDEPYGVVLGIAPWNAPFPLGVRSFGAPIAAGNTVVWKVSEFSPRTGLALLSCFRDAGLPDGVVNMIVHDRNDAAAVTEALIANPLVKKINFTGSTAIGRVIARTAGQHLKPVVLELGGKAPAIVWEDADLKIAGFQCALGAFDNIGQVCMSTEKIIVHKSIKKAFCEELAASIEMLLPSKDEAPVLINAAAVEKNRNLVNDAVSKGASVIFGSPEAKEASATRMRPIVLEKVTKEMDIYSTESFGPTVSLIEIETEEEAIEIANDTEYGLTSAVFTEDLRRAFRFAREIESGAVHINSMTIHDEAFLPHGGAKSSGYGRFNSTCGIQEWVRNKTISFKN